MKIIGNVNNGNDHILIKLLGSGGVRSMILSERGHAEFSDQFKPGGISETK